MVRAGKPEPSMPTWLIIQLVSIAAMPAVYDMARDRGRSTRAWLYIAVIVGPFCHVETRLRVDLDDLAEAPADGVDGVIRSDAINGRFLDATDLDYRRRRGGGWRSGRRRLGFPGAGFQAALIALDIEAALVGFGDGNDSGRAGYYGA